VREACELSVPVGAATAGQRMRKVLRLASWPLVKLLVLLARGYQLLVAPALGARCRFEPSCSCYAIQSLEKDGLVRGVFKTAWRLCRCQPYGKGGYDPP
jgi:putative membrane protein insertion efficiency factor